MAWISEDVIREIRYRNSIEDVVSSYVTLKRAGSNLLGLCPFHSEKTASFTVFPNTESFHCFGCGAGGDVISFVRRIENLDYPSAVEFLAKRAGITIVQDDRDKERMQRRKRVLDMNVEAARFFRSCLYDPKLGAAGMRYLSEKRKLDPALIRHFGLGFAPNDFGLLTRHLSKLGYKDYEMSDAFLAGISKKNGKSYDYFRNRVIFPILDISGDVVAFGGRVMDDSLPKYLNTSDTPAFKKSRNLFAMNFARKHCEEQLILCEGYMDVIALHGAGFQNAVATLGTAITPEHARLMKRYTKSVIISYDSDEAGQRAADKAFKLLSEVGLETRVLKLDGAKDPDEYIKSFGKDRFALLLKDTKSEFDFRFDNILKKYDTRLVDEKLKAIEEIEGVIAQVPSAAGREVYIGVVAEKMGISAEMIRRDVDKRTRRAQKATERRETERLIAASQGIGDRVNTDFVKNPQAASCEEKILGILLLHPEYLYEMKKKDKAPSAEDFFTEFGKKIYTLMFEIDREYFDISALGSALSVEEIDRLQKLQMSRTKLANNKIELLYELLETLKHAKEKSELSLEEIIRRKRDQKKMP
ncbi:MAG: DNA primase [Clostridia bacterium]|nr:DNA primase [Clostridia bacterium]